MIEVTKGRRSIRKYTGQDISDALLDELLETATRASNTGNMQLYSVVVTRDKANKEKLSPLHFNQPMIKNAPVVLTFCADTNRFIKWCEQRNADVGFRDFQSLQAAMIDTIIFAQTFCDAAEEKGLGICYLGTTSYNADRIAEALSLPKCVVPIVTVTVGYPASLPEQSDRLPLDAIRHTEVYTDYTPESIDVFYKEKEALEVNKKFVEENKKETLAQVYTDVRYAKSTSEHYSGVLLKTLKEQGFSL